MKKRFHFRPLLFATIAAIQLCLTAFRSNAQITASGSPSPLCNGQTAILTATAVTPGSPYMAIPIPNANANTYGPYLTPTVLATLKGAVSYLPNNVPFLVPNAANGYDSWSAHFPAAGGTTPFVGPDTLNIPVDCPPITDTLYTLINTYWGVTNPSLVTLRLTFIGGGGGPVTIVVPLVGDSTMRDFRYTCPWTTKLSTTWSTVASGASISAQRVWSAGTPGTGSFITRDLQRIVIPAPFNAAPYRLSNIKLTDNGHANNPSACNNGKQRVFISGASIHVRTPLTLPPITWHSGSVSGPVVGYGPTIGVSPSINTSYFAVADSSCFAQVNIPVQLCCVDDCYWKVTGNTILNGNNKFGTVSNDDIRIHTNNNAVGIITKGGKYGFGGMTPNNTVEITQGTAGNSGLRFTNLKNTDPAITNTTNKILSVNPSGDVILVNDAGGGAANNGVSLSPTGEVQLGQDCNNGSGAGLTSHRAIPMDENNIEFRDGVQLTPGNNRIGIGTSGCQPQAKLEVVRNAEMSVYDLNNIAISGVNRDNTDFMAKGIYGEANSARNPINIGGDFMGLDGRKASWGVRGIGQTADGYEAVGGWFSACGPQRNVGVFATACNGGAPCYAAEFAGDALINGVYYPSDKRVKQNIEPIVGALDLLQKIQPKTYQFNTTVYPGLNLPANTLQYGVISQELEQVLPSLVKEAPIPDGKNGFLKETIKAVNYTELIPILIQAIKDQQAQIETLSATIAGQKATDFKAATTQSGGYLAQNVPNPFSASTVIKYELPTGAQKSYIGVYDMNGKELRLFPLSPEKTGSVTIQGNELMPGMYLYSLIVDGNYFDSKKMILTSR